MFLRRIIISDCKGTNKRVKYQIYLDISERKYLTSVYGSHHRISRTLTFTQVLVEIACTTLYMKYLLQQTHTQVGDRLG